MKKICLLISLAVLLLSCHNNKKQTDCIIYNAVIYTVDSAFSVTQAIVIDDGKIVATGKNEDILKNYDAVDVINAEGKFIYPGFIDAHAHFLGYALALQTANLTGTGSWDEIIDTLKTFAANHQEGWLTGRGWDQNDWPVKEFPDNSRLNELFPDRPVLLTRVDGHAAIANQKALEIAGVQPGQQLTGGSIETKNKQLTGILIDNAIALVRSKIPDPDREQVKNALLRAQQNCFAVGLTTVDDCGLRYQDIELIDTLQQKDGVKMRIYAMLSDKPENYEYIFKRGKIKTDRLHVCSFKVYADGALGSRGACLLKPYTDKPGWQGFLLSSAAHFDSVARVIYNHNFQMCTHAIGDSGNRLILHTYAKYLKQKNNKRWRIEHAQVVNTNDFKLFGKYSIIPSVQPTHATSDMYWVATRLGPERIKGAYAYKTLLKQNGWMPLGTDFPVEDISPFKTFYAAVVRKDAKGWPAHGYQTENALSRQATLRGMTIWAAKSNFEDQEKGSLEKGKLADFIITDKDLMQTPPEQLLNIHVLSTYINGDRVYEQTASFDSAQDTDKSK
jgi:predicted amidohydrolase YtcJ